MKHLFYISFFLITLLACKTGAIAINNGTQAYEQKKFVQAVDLLKKEVANENDSFKKIEKLRLLAESYSEMNNPEGAVEAYQAILELDKNPQHYFDLAIAQKRNEDYSGALENLKEYRNLTRDEFYSNPHIKYTEEALNYVEAKGNVKITNLEKINSSASDYAARIYKNKALVISSSKFSANGDKKQPWDGEKNADLYVAKYDGKRWNNSQSFDPLINTELAEGVITFDSKFETAYFTRCDYLELGNSYCRIYQTQADGDSWYAPTLLTIFSDSVNIGQPFLSQDGQRLYFSSDANFGYGGNDIYFMIKQGNAWSEPYNAGFYVNTEKDELFPTTDSKGNLYFSSNGRQGYGGLDIFKASPDKQAFAASELLPYPINSGADDFSFQFLKEQLPGIEDLILESAVFTSSRQDGKGKDDIYLYEKLFINFYALDLTVLEKQYKDPNNSESEVLGMQALEGSIILMKEQERITPTSGNLLFELQAETDYKLLITKSGYFNKSLEISTTGLKTTDSLTITIFKEVVLEKIFPEKEIVIKNIYYDYDKATLRAESLPVLDKLVSFFDENQDLVIEIGSHTDSRGSDKYNQELSQRRAQSVVDYFISKGVPSSQLSAKGYGETKITNECSNGFNCSEEKHQENRRTTFRVISSNGVLESN